MGLLDSMKQVSLGVHPTYSNILTGTLQPASYVKKKQYVFTKLLGTGAFAEVKEATWTRPDGSGPLEVAVKIIRKKKLGGDTEAVFEEMNVLKELDHPNISKSPRGVGGERELGGAGRVG
jgi:serine/threonine protein kinase